MTKFFKFSNVLLIIITLLTYLSPFINPIYFWPNSILVVGLPLLLLTNLLFALFWLIKKKKFAIYSSICLLLGSPFIDLLINYPLLKKNEEKELMRINVASANTNNLKSPRNYGKPAALKYIKQSFDAIEMDIILFQEFPNRHKMGSLTHIEEYFQIERGLPYLLWDVSGQLRIFSRYPIEDVNSQYFKNETNGFQIVDITINEKKYRFFNIHLQSSAISPYARYIMRRGSIKDKRTWNSVKEIFRRYIVSAKQRAKQSVIIAEQIKQSPHPVILAGDFNEVAFSYVYFKLSKGLKDTFRKKGSGFGNTFSGNRPLIRIDYILTSPEIKTLDHQISPIPLSDHMLIRSQLELP